MSTPAVRLRVFVVEDDPDTRTALMMYLRHLGHDAACACSFGEAVTALTQSRHDVLIADIGLGDGSGWDLIPHLRSLGVEPPPVAVAMSGFGMSEDHTRSRKAGFAAHLLKPFDAARLKALLTDVTTESTAQRPGDLRAD